MTDGSTAFLTLPLFTTSVDEILDLPLASSFESLKDTYLYLTKDDEITVNNKKVKNCLVLNYKNNEANVGTFHLYVPVYVTYSFGEFDYDGIHNTIWSSSKNASHFNYAALGGLANKQLYLPFRGNRTKANDSMDKENDVPPLNATGPLFTQKVWATIVVNQTTQSQTQTARQK